MGEVLLVVGGAGGPTIITGTLHVILNVLEHRMTWADAMNAPRIHHQARPDSLLYAQDGFTESVADSLRSMRHTLVAVPGLGNINGIMHVRGGWHGTTQQSRPEVPWLPGTAVGF